MQLRFDNSFARELPADPVRENRRRQVYGACYSVVEPTPVAAPQLIASSAEVCELLGISPEQAAAQTFVEVLSGNRLLPGMLPTAACYGGHQFGNWAGQLGDGRAISLGEVIDRRGGRQELQLKGAGSTPYSRMGDGRAVLRSSLREFLCSEAMFHLGVPTTRALSLIGTGERVERDMLYDGRPRLEPGAIVCRVAPSFLRFGNYQLFAARDDLPTLRRLLDYTLRTHFPELAAGRAELGAAEYLSWFEQVCLRTSELVVHWMRVGFVHGVLNTDNMSVLGLTIDYGPYGWLEDYNPNWTPNTTDAMGRRYRFGRQPQVVAWNLARLAEALLPLSGEPERLEAALHTFVAQSEQALRRMQRQKLGLERTNGAPTSPDAQSAPTSGQDPQLADELVASLHELLQRQEIDMTIFYRRLAELELAELAPEGDVELTRGLWDAFYAEPERDTLLALAAWLRRYAALVRQSESHATERRARMNAVNPKYVLRNYLAQQAIDEAERGQYELLAELLDVLRRPYDEQPGRARFAERRPEWARSRVGCSMLSCSS